MFFENLQLHTKHFGFAGPTASGDLFPAIQITRYLKQASANIKWILLGWEHSTMKDFHNYILVETDRRKAMEAVSSNHPSKEALTSFSDGVKRYRDAVYEESKHLDAIIIAPATFLCPVADNCKVFPLFFQNNFFTHPDCWLSGSDSYAMFAERQDILINPNTHSLICWDPKLYTIDPVPKERHEYVGITKITREGKFPLPLQNFLKNCKKENLQVLFVTVGSTYIREKEEWISLAKHLSPYGALVIDCRNQPVNQEELEVYNKQNPIYFLDEDIDLDTFFVHIDWIICHGGFGTCMNAIYAGVPIIIMPGHLEQQWWCKKHVKNGYAQHLDIAQLHDKTYLDALLDSSVHKKCRKKAKEMKDSCNFDGLMVATRRIIEEIA